MNKYKEIADEIVREYFGGYLPNSLADEGMACATNAELYSLVEKVELYYMSEHPTAVIEDEDAVHRIVTDTIKGLNDKFVHRVANHCYYDFGSLKECESCSRKGKCWDETIKLLKDESNNIG